MKPAGEQRVPHTCLKWTYQKYSASSETVYPPMKKKGGKMNSYVNFLDKIYMETGDYELALFVVFVFMRENTVKLVAATLNLKSKYCC